MHAVTCVTTCMNMAHMYTHSTHVHTYTNMLRGRVTKTIRPGAGPLTLPGICSFPLQGWSLPSLMDPRLSPFWLYSLGFPSTAALAGRPNLR